MQECLCFWYLWPWFVQVGELECWRVLQMMYTSIERWAPSQATVIVRFSSCWLALDLLSCSCEYQCWYAVFNGGLCLVTDHAEHARGWHEGCTGERPFTIQPGALPVSPLTIITSMHIACTSNVLFPNNFKPIKQLIIRYQWFLHPSTVLLSTVLGWRIQAQYKAELCCAWMLLHSTVLLYRTVL